MAVVFGPSQLGKPIRRGRYMSFCYDTTQVAFLGSALHFQRLFCQRSRHLDGDIFYVAPPEFVQAKLDQLVKETMCGLDKGSVPTFMDCHTGTQQCNAKAYLAKQQSLIEKGCSSEEAFIYDLEQSCASRPRFGSTMPCLITHGLMYSAHHQRPLLEEEHLSAMGLPVWPEMQQFCNEMTKGQVRFKMPFDQRLFSRNTIKRFAGNGMDFLSLGSWVGYCLANVLFLG